MCRHADGVVSHLGATSLSGAPGPRVRLLGTEAAYVMADFTGEPHVWSGQADGRRAQRLAVPRRRARAGGARQRPQADLYRAVAAALASDDPQAAMPVDPWDAVHTLAVIDAARVSAAAGARAFVAVETPRRRTLTSGGWGQGRAAADRGAPRGALPSPSRVTT